MAAAIYTNVTTVTTHGTRVVLATSQAINSGVSIKALSTNTGLIYVGNSTVTSGNGFELAKGEAITVITPNLANVYIDSGVDGEGVSYIAT